MNKLLLIFPIFFPMICGLLMLAKPLENRRTRNIFVFIVTCITSAVIFVSVFAGFGEAFTLLDLDANFHLTFRMDGLSKVFALIVSVLWPIAILYSFEYMSYEQKENRFFAFYTITYGVVMGIAEAQNFFTLYLFYEMLTLATLPLVMHEMDAKARYAGKKYIIYSMSGAALSFIAMILIAHNGSLAYSMGGSGAVSGTAAQIVFLLGFFGFGAKAAIVPLHSWLPSAGVAPTPVTALLHAVAVVNSGVFAILRLIYYMVGADNLLGTPAQAVAIGFACLTIVFGSLMALRNQNLKRRLAYSTVSNLSYILLGAALMCPAGLAAALMHMVAHSIIKITLFFCAGALLVATGNKRRNIGDYEGFGRKYKFLFVVFAIASAALIGIPPLAGFTSKWAITSAAAALGTPFAIAGVIALCISAFLTGLYLIDVLITAVWPRNNAKIPEDKELIKLKWPINTALCVLSVILISVSLFANRIFAALQAIAGIGAAL